ncbi:divergent polysaccharide deacetylase family protein [Marinomonas epiphytica]
MSYIRSYVPVLRAKQYTLKITAFALLIQLITPTALMAEQTQPVMLLGPLIAESNEQDAPKLNELGPLVDWTEFLPGPASTPAQPKSQPGIPYVLSDDDPQEDKVVKPDTEQVEQTKLVEVEVKEESIDKAKIVILIDDLGYNRKGMEGALALPNEVALAILPSTPFAQKTALTSKEQGRLIILHAPMETEHKFKLGPGGLYADMTEQELKETLLRDIESLPDIQGVNNHMGSLLTAQPDAMQWVMETLKPRSLFFIDSLTSPHSVAEQTAKEMGLKTAKRDVFLDNFRTEKAIDKQFSRLVKLAHKQGIALAIGHPYPETMTYLKKRLAQLESDHVELVPLTAILK